MSAGSNVLGCDTMLTLRQGSQAYRLVSLLSVVGEYPIHSLHLLGNERVFRDLIRRMAVVQKVRNPVSGEQMETKLLQLSGSGRAKSIRLYKGALPILEWVHPDALRYYMASFWNHRFPGDEAHRDRNHRVAETAAFCTMAGIEIFPYQLPKLQMDSLAQVVPETPSLYLARDIKKIHASEQNKTMFTRTVGALFYPGGCYAVYNTRDAAMKWNGMGEFKALHSLSEVARMNAGVQKIDSAVLLGNSAATALSTLMESARSRRREFRFDSIYRHIYFLPMEQTGMRRLRMLTLPDWNGKLLDLLFEPGSRSYDKGFMEYDACINGVYVLSHLDGDLARLIRFHEAVDLRNGRFEVLCFPDQVPLLREYLSLGIRLKTISMDLVEAELGLNGRCTIE